MKSSRKGITLSFFTYNTEMKITYKHLFLALALLPALSGCGSTQTKPISTTAPTSTTASSTPHTVGSAVPANSPIAHGSTASNNNAQIMHDDLWQRVRSGFQFTGGGLPEQALEQLEWFTNRPDYLNRIAERATPYLYYIVEQVEARGMPLEIALLPVVESGFQPFARSSAAAAGLWQFIPSTGKHFGLAQNKWYDGRRDVVSATDAALTYLQKLYADFGSWKLALAAYNAGEGRVGRAIKANQKAGLGTDFWSLKLPKETKAYVPRLMALSHLVQSPEAYNQSLQQLPNEPYFDVIDVDSQIDFAIAAKMANIDLKSFYYLNPGYNQWTTPLKGSYKLLIPVEQSANFQAQLATMSDEEKLNWKHYTIKRGDSISKIAKQYQTSSDVVKHYNPTEVVKLTAGNTLRIPTPSVALKHYRVHPIQQRLARRDVKRLTHTVKRGDSWWAIARRYGVDVNKLAAWNKSKSSKTLRPGQKLVVLQGSAARRSAGSPAKSSKLYYKVKSGDSLWGIAHRYQVHVAEVKRWNKLGTGGIIKPGQKLLINLPK